MRDIKDNISAAALAEIGSLPSENKNVMLIEEENLTIKLFKNG